MDPAASRLFDLLHLYRLASASPIGFHTPLDRVTTISATYRAITPIIGRHLLLSSHFYNLVKWNDITWTPSAILVLKVGYSPRVAQIEDKESLDELRAKIDKCLGLLLLHEGAIKVERDLCNEDDIY